MARLVTANRKTTSAKIRAHYINGVENVFSEDKTHPLLKRLWRPKWVPLGTSTVATERRYTKIYPGSEY